MSETSTQSDLAASVHDGETTTNSSTMDARSAPAELHDAPLPPPTPVPPAVLGSASLAGVPNMQTAVATMRAGLAPDADGAARAAAMDLWSRLEVVLSSGAAFSPHVSTATRELPAMAVAPQPLPSPPPLPSALAGSPIGDMVSCLAASAARSTARSRRLSSARRAPRRRRGRGTARDSIPARASARRPDHGRPTLTPHLKGFMLPSSLFRVLALLCVLGCSSVSNNGGRCCCGGGNGSAGSGSAGSDGGSGSGGSGSDAGSGTPATSQIQVSWSTAVQGTPVTCAGIGAVSVELRLRPRSGGDLAFVYPCSDGHDISPAVVAGPYDATLFLVAADGSRFGEGAARAVQLDADQVAQLPSYVFDLPTNVSHFELSLASLGSASHCAAQPDGSGISAHVLSLRDADGVCMPVTFTRVRAGIPNGTYTVNCSTPVAGPCIERDEKLAIDVLPSGPYTVSVTGLTGDAHQICWQGHDVLQIPVGSAAKTVQLARVGGQGC